jgi:two-component system chemotaxis response regulator CheY
MKSAAFFVLPLFAASVISVSLWLNNKPVQTAMPKRVLDVGQCGPDHATIRSYFKRNFDCEIVQSHGADDTLAQLKNGRFDLVLINRKLDADYSDGIEILRKIKADAAVADVPVMIVTNYPEHQDAAVAAGALRGFGKLEYDKPETRDKIAAALQVAAAK